MRGVVVFNMDKRNVCSDWCVLVSTEAFLGVCGNVRDVCGI